MLRQTVITASHSHVQILAFRQRQADSQNKRDGPEGRKGCAFGGEEEVYRRREKSKRESPKAGRGVRLVWGKRRYTERERNRVGRRE